jgi:hypothetical protein
VFICVESCAENRSRGQLKAINILTQSLTSSSRNFVVKIRKSGAGLGLNEFLSRACCYLFTTRACFFKFYLSRWLIKRTDSRELIFLRSLQSIKRLAAAAIGVSNNNIINVALGALKTSLSLALGFDFLRYPPRVSSQNSFAATLP